MTWRTSQSSAHMYVPEPDDVATSTSIPSIGREADVQWPLRAPQRSPPALRRRRIHTHEALRSSCPDPLEKTRCMSPIPITASRPASVCPVPAHLRPTIIYSGRRKRFHASRNPGLLRLMPGAYLHAVPGRRRWEQRFMVSLARAIAAQQLLPSATCLSHTSAALIQGLAMWTREPDVYLAVSGNPRLTTTTMPAFRYPPSGVPTPIHTTHPEATPIRMHRRRLQLRDEEIEVVGGVPVTSVLRTAFDCACDEPPYNALSIADAALNRHCQPDPWHRDSCTTRLHSARASWEELVARHRGRRGIAQARAVLAAATPWAVSPGESVLRWMTLVVGLPEAIAQYPVPGLSKDRFLDLGWPDHRVVAEFDGRTKYRTEEDVFLEKLRQDELETQGWRLFRTTWSSLSDMRTQADRLLSMFPLEVVSRLSPVAGLQGGGLWGERPPGVLVP